jgi:hypothetical protein
MRRSGPKESDNSVMSHSRWVSRGIRRFAIPIGAVTAAAALGAGIVAANYSQDTADPANSLAGRASALPATPAPVPGVLTGSPAPTKTRQAGAGGAAIDIATAPIIVRYTFDGGLGRSIADEDGTFPLQAVTQNNGTLAFTPRDDGLAMQFPARCTLPEETCPRAILEGTRIDALNPGTRPLQYGASILMTPADVADGANVLQKGYSVGGISQFKLQVDHAAARPSCVIASKAKIYRTEPRINVADGVWHDLACTRSGSRLIITVDGVNRGSVYVPPALSIANPEPLRIGGKGANTGNDQFAGQIDNVFVSIG